MWIQVNNKILADLRSIILKLESWSIVSGFEEAHNRDHSDRKPLQFTWPDDNRFIWTSMTDCDDVCHSIAYIHM